CELHLYVAHRAAQHRVHARHHAVRDGGAECDEPGQPGRRQALPRRHVAAAPAGDPERLLRRHRSQAARHRCSLHCRDLQRVRGHSLRRGSNMKYFDKRFSRRNFLKAGARLGALAAFGRPGEAFATTAGDYKALVCIYLAGGCDGNNMIIPLDAARYGSYASARTALAIPMSKLGSTSFTHQGMPYAFHYGLPKLHARYQQGRVAMALNTG